MIFELLKKAIEQHNAFMTKDMIALQIEFFYVAGKLSVEEYNILKSMLIPIEQV